MKKSILFVHNGNQTFEKCDLGILSQSYPVTDFYISSKRDLSTSKVLQQVRRHDLVFGWFASWHTFLPVLFARLLGKPSVLVIGGYDVANLPAANYGHQRGGLKKWIGRWTMQLANILVTHSIFAQKEIEENTRLSKKRIVVVYLGVPDTIRTFPTTKENIVLTVGNVESDNLLRKGHEPFIRAAHSIPEMQFHLVGRWRDGTINYLRSIASPNACFEDWLPEKDLLDYYRRSSIYVQASMHETFGLSVAEAMLGGCIPVVTSIGSLPEVVGDTGIYARSQDPGDVENAIREAMQCQPSIRMTARQRILDCFPVEKRSAKVIQVVEQALVDSQKRLRNPEVVL